MKFSLGDYQKVKDLSHKWPFKNLYTAVDTSILFCALVKLVDAEDIAIEKIRILELPLEINKATSKLENHNLPFQTYDSNPETKFTQTIDPINKKQGQLRKTVSIVINATLLFSTVFESYDRRRRKRTKLLFSIKIVCKII